jgi:hypothetical protein
MTLVGRPISASFVWPAHIKRLEGAPRSTEACRVLTGSVCGGHIQDQWRIAYTFEHSAGDDPTLVVILTWIATTSDSDPWDDLHELFELGCRPAHVANRCWV